MTDHIDEAVRALEQMTAPPPPSGAPPVTRNRLHGAYGLTVPPEQVEGGAGGPIHRCSQDPSRWHRQCYGTYGNGLDPATGRPWPRQQCQHPATHLIWNDLSCAHCAYVAVQSDDDNIPVRALTDEELALDVNTPWDRLETERDWWDGPAYNHAEAEWAFEQWYRATYPAGQP